MIYIDQHSKRLLRAPTGYADAPLDLVMFDALALTVRFRNGDAPASLALGSTLRLVLKPLEGGDTAPARLNATFARSSPAESWVTLETQLCDSAAMRADIANCARMQLRAQFVWQEPGHPEQRSQPLLASVQSSPAQPTEAAPEPASDAWFTELTAVLTAGENITLTPQPMARTITVAASGNAAPQLEATTSGRALRVLSPDGSTVLGYLPLLAGEP
jgi:hypothetical protein